ncbi:MAG TPA: glycosyltransferase family 2 protein [Candidatus Acidoferrum sp.]|nr:glycosyltransferase family 2 protein [Candidatus Acidoferrum sp.]
MAPTLTRILEVIFWLSAAVLAYVYVFYPLLLGLLARAFPQNRETQNEEKLRPSVSLLISAYNEEEVIGAKLENSLKLDYPKELLEVLVVSDCSSDGTDEIVKKHSCERVKLVRLEERKGKTAGLNAAVPQTRGEILVFSDANAIYEQDAIQQLVRHFRNPQVGYVVGNARYVQKLDENRAAAAEGLYWKVETWLKKQESKFDSVVGGDGAIYAIRRELYQTLLPTDINDFLNPLQIIYRGYRGIFEPAAVSYEATAESFDKEFRRKVRIISRSLNAVGRVPGVLNPFRRPRHWFLLVSHKILRWFAPIFMILAFALSCVLWSSPIYRALVLLQACFYVFALIGWSLRKQERLWRPFSLAFYFCLMNAASLVGCIKCFRRELSGTWTPPRQNVSGSA